MSMASDTTTVFRNSDYLRINEARLEHLISLISRFDFTGKSVLELGAGIGDHTQFWIDRGCKVTTSDARPENQRILRERFPTLDVRLIDLDRSPLPAESEQFDIVYAYGLLYHLQNPERGIRYIAATSRWLAFIETCVSFGDECAIHPIQESFEDASQSFSGTGCRPTRPWVYKTLKSVFAFVYQPGTQPAHEQFPLDWSSPSSALDKLSRTTFVASHTMLEHSGLYARLLDRQTLGSPASISSSSLVQFMANLGICNVIDVGAATGQFATSLRAHGFQGHIASFEPLAEALLSLRSAATQDPHWSVYGVALGASEGTASINISANQVSSSFLEIEERTVRAEPSTRYQGISIVDIDTLDRVWDSLKAEFCDAAIMLKLDVQGYETNVIRGAEHRLAEIELVFMECSLVSIYKDEPVLADMLLFMAARGFFPVWMQTGWSNRSTGQVYQCDIAFARAPDVSAVPPAVVYKEPRITTRVASMPERRGDYPRCWQILASSFSTIRDEFARGALIEENEWALATYILKHLPISHGQLFQDLMVLYTLNDLRNGFFVEIGAADGMHLSNTYLLETQFGWKGIVAEPARCWRIGLMASRNCYVSTECVSAESGELVIFNETNDPVYSTIDAFSQVDLHGHLRADGQRYVVETVSIRDLLRKGSAPSRIHYMSIDTEGSELAILQAINFAEYHIDILTIEHNHTEARQKIFEYMTAQGYIRKFEMQSSFDDWYFKSIGATSKR